MAACSGLEGARPWELEAKPGLHRCVKEPALTVHAPDQDAADAIDNMHNAELYGRVLRCNYAQPMKIKGGDKGFSHQPVWADADDWYERAEAEHELEKLTEEQQKKAAAEKLKPGQLVADPMEAAEAAALAGGGAS